MMIKKVDTSFIGGANGAKNSDFGVYFEVQATYLAGGRHEPHQTCRKGVLRCFTTSYQISSQKFGRKILFGQKSKMSTRWL